MLRLIQESPWPGNVRQLINCVRRVIGIAEDNWIGVEDFRMEHKGKQYVGKNELPSPNEARWIAERTLSGKPFLIIVVTSPVRPVSLV